MGRWSSEVGQSVVSRPQSACRMRSSERSATGQRPSGQRGNPQRGRGNGMTRPQAVIAEDEEPQRRKLIELLGEIWPELKIVAQCEDGLSALESVTSLQPAVAYLDIRMPGLT